MYAVATERVSNGIYNGSRATIQEINIFERFRAVHDK